MTRTKLLLVAGLVALGACRSSDAPGEKPQAAKAEKESAGTDAPEVIATWKGGEATAAEVESRLGEVPQRRGAVDVMDADARLDALVNHYRRAARSAAVASILLAKVPDRAAAIEALKLSDRQRAMRRQVTLQAYMREGREAIEIGDEQIRAYYEAHQERFHTPKRAMLWNIYRRHEDPAHPEKTIAFLAELRGRFLAGETFESLAREYSESETRLRSGAVGRYTAAELPEKLAEVVFALDEGSVSEPLPVKDGTVLVHVSEVVDGADVGIDEARERIRRLLQAEALDAEIARRTRDLEPPAGSTLLTVEELDTALQGDDPEKEVLAVGEVRITAQEMARFAVRAPVPEGVDPKDASEEARRKRLAAAYRKQLDLALLYGILASDPSAMPAEAQREAEERITEMQERLLVDEEIRRRVGEAADADPEKLRKFYEDNAHHFQSALRFKLRQLAVPAGKDAMATMAALERLRAKLAAGETDLDRVAAEMGGKVEDLGWQEFDKLRDIPRKARTYLLELGGTGYTIPYPNGDDLQLLQVEERDEPKPLGYEEARERVRQEYLKRNQRALSQQVTDQILAAAGYRFDEQATRRYLAPPS